MTEIYYVYFDNQQGSDWPDLMTLENPLNAPHFNEMERAMLGIPQGDRDGWVWVHRLGYNGAKDTHYITGWTAINLNHISRIDEVEEKVEAKE